MTDFLPLIAGMILTILAIFVARQRISTVERDILGKAAPTEIVVAASSSQAMKIDVILHRDLAFF